MQQSSNTMRADSRTKRATGLFTSSHARLPLLLHPRLRWLPGDDCRRETAGAGPTLLSLQHANVNARHAPLGLCRQRGGARLCLHAGVVRSSGTGVAGGAAEAGCGRSGAHCRGAEALRTAAGTASGRLGANRRRHAPPASAPASTTPIPCSCRRCCSLCRVCSGSAGGRAIAKAL